MGLLLSTVVHNQCECCNGTGKYPAYTSCSHCYGTGLQLSLRHIFYNGSESVKSFWNRVSSPPSPSQVIPLPTISSSETAVSAAADCAQFHQALHPVSLRRPTACGALLCRPNARCSTRLASCLLFSSRAVARTQRHRISELSPP